MTKTKAAFRYVTCNICGYNVPSHLIDGHLLVDLGWHFNYEVRDDTDSQSYWLLRFLSQDSFGICKYTKEALYKPYIIRFEHFPNAYFHKFQDMYEATLDILERSKNGGLF